jgi:predicted  nucleic acid-binding Zn-ribbon protein
MRACCCMSCRFTRWTEQIIDRRSELELERYEMARLIEIKGLGTAIADVKKGIGELRAAAGELNVEKSGLTAEIKDLTEQLKEHRKDLRFEAETLGNSSGDTDEEETKPSPAASTAIPSATLGPQPNHPEVEKVAQTFRAAE